MRPFSRAGPPSSAGCDLIPARSLRYGGRLFGEDDWELCGVEMSGVLGATLATHSRDSPVESRLAHLLDLDHAPRHEDVQVHCAESVHLAQTGWVRTSPGDFPERASEVSTVDAIVRAWQESKVAPFRPVPSRQLVGKLILLV